MASVPQFGSTEGSQIQTKQSKNPTTSERQKRRLSGRENHHRNEFKKKNPEFLAGNLKCRISFLFLFFASFKFFRANFFASNLIMNGPTFESTQDQNAFLFSIVPKHRSRFIPSLTEDQSSTFSLTLSELRLFFKDDQSIDQNGFVCDAVETEQPRNIPGKLGRSSERHGSN